LLIEGIRYLGRNNLCASAHFISLLNKPSHRWTIRPMVKNGIDSKSRNSTMGIGSVTEKLGLGIKCCELALSSGSARTWEHKIKNAQKAHDTALRFLHRFDLSEHEARRVNQRITHLKTLLAELR
jgi:hypothetical protein